ARRGVAAGGGADPRRARGVPQGEGAGPDERWLRGAVDEPEDLPGIDPAVEAAPGRVGEPPRRARDRDGGGAGVLAYGQPGRWIVEVGPGGRDVVPVGEGQRGSPGVRPPLRKERARGLANRARDLR